MDVLGQALEVIDREPVGVALDVTEERVEGGAGPIELDAIVENVLDRARVDQVVPSPVGELGIALARHGLFHGFALLLLDADRDRGGLLLTLDLLAALRLALLGLGGVGGLPRPAPKQHVCHGT
jgi:hypothetical protein